jgi:hypothetical protein
MDALQHVTNVSQVIQLAVAPVFLLAGVGATLNVLATRIARIIDRARVVENKLPGATPEVAEDLQRVLQVLSKRGRIVNRAIGLTVLSGILVSLVVAALFVSAEFNMNLATPIAIAFVVALLSIATALIFFLREVVIATESLRFGAKPGQKNKWSH